MKTSKKWKTEKHPGGPSSRRYALVHTSKLSFFFVFMHVCMLQITCMHRLQEYSSVFHFLRFSLNLYVHVYVYVYT